MPQKLSSRKMLGLCAIVLLAFALRLYHLDAPTLRWDEGWSIGLGSLSWREIPRVAALEVHPPLFYLLLKPWLWLGKSSFSVRFFAVIGGVLLVPLGYVVARRWSGRERVGWLVALYMAAAPLLVYYGQVARMYPLCALLLLLSTHCLLRALDGNRTCDYVAFVLAGTAALYTFYYNAFVLAALLAYALLARRRRWRCVVLSGLTTALLYVPWVIYAAGEMLARVGTRTGFSFVPESAAKFARLLQHGLLALTFAYGPGWLAVGAVALILGGGALLARPWRGEVRRLLLPLLAMIFVLTGVALGVRAYMFAARLLLPAAPFLGLALAWATDVLWRRRIELGIVALILLAAVTVWPFANGQVYAKSLEVVDPLDPQTFYEPLRGRTRPQDIVFFNNLSPAGFYEHFRQPDDPSWSYVLRWDPSIESLDEALDQRVRPAAQAHRRLWFVLYKGAVAANYELKYWLDTNLYPSTGWWHEDTLYLLYVSPAAPLTSVPQDAHFGPGIQLTEAAFTARACAGGEVAVRLLWQATERPPASYKVFVHIYTPDGQLVTQHDGFPVNEMRPTDSWHPGEDITDNHGLLLPADTPSRLQVVVGIYDPATDQRLPLADGGDVHTVGEIEVFSPE
ncbi:MAG: glycosyltransferase family 39 protein [Chloroflexota bacterium]|nr:glycosyltransferase family 39 protein [Chloroflexota bacterium]